MNEPVELYEKVLNEHRYPTTVSVVYSETGGNTITIHHAKTPGEAAELIRITKEQIKIKEQYRK